MIVHLSWDANLATVLLRKELDYCGQLISHFVWDLLCLAEIDKGRLAVRADKNISRMRVSMEKSFCKDHSPECICECLQQGTTKDLQEQCR